MKILIENSGYHLLNMGDLAMLQVALSRLSSLWPHSKLYVFTTDTDLLAKFCPNAHPLHPPKGELWFPCLFERLQRFIPNNSVKKWYVEFEWFLHKSLSILTTPLLRSKLRKRSRHNSSLDFLWNIVENVDLVVASGGGYITDAFPYKATQALSILNLATWLKKPTIMLGHGLGPLQDTALESMARTVLPRVDFISLRENQFGSALLKKLNVCPRHIAVTGDDALELAYNARQPELGSGIGINLRIASYSEVGSDISDLVREVLVGTAAERNVPLIPIPIARSETSNDCKAIRLLLAEYDQSSDGGEALDAPMKVVEQVGHCRLVVTGSYHAGVFALAQGIPVICLAKSEYYIHKFVGLANQFGGVGCAVLLLNNPQLKEQLSNAINDAWESAEINRPRILKFANEQIESSLIAYQTVYKLIKN